MSRMHGAVSQDWAFGPEDEAEREQWLAALEKCLDLATPPLEPESEDGLFVLPF